MWQARSFSELLKDSWLEPQAYGALVECVQKFDPAIENVSPVKPLEPGPDGGIDYAGLCEGGRYVAIDLKQPDKDPGLGKLWVAVLTSPGSNKPGWALRDDSMTKTECLVCHYRDTKRMIAYDFKWLRRILSLRLKVAFLASPNPNHLNVFTMKGGKKSGGAFIVTIENLHAWALECADQPYIDFATSVNQDDWHDIRHVGLTL